MSYYTAEIPVHNFKYPTGLGYIFEGESYISSVCITKGHEPYYCWFEFEYFPMDYMQEVYLYFQGNKYRALQFIPSYPFIHRDRWNMPGQELAQDMLADGFTVEEFPELADYLDTSPPDELESAIKRNRRRAKDEANYAASTANNPIYAPKAVFGNSGIPTTTAPTPWLAPVGVRRGEVTLITAKENCGVSRYVSIYKPEK